MTRVLQVLGQSAGGIARHVSQLVEFLDGEGTLELDVAGPPDLPVAMPKPVLPVTIPGGPVGGHRRAVVRLRALVQEGDYDVVHAHGLRAGIDAALAVRASPTPVLLTVHNLVRSDISGTIPALAYGWAEPLAVRLTSHTFAVSEEIARRLRARSGGAADRVETLYLGIGSAPEVATERDEVRARLRLGPGAHLVVTASRLSAQKAVDVMLAALVRLPESVTLAVLGRGPAEPGLKVRAAALGVAERVRWLGWRDDSPDFVAAADVFCLSSVWEGIPLAAQEAILLGVPVVATSVGGMPELIEDRRSGRLVPKGDAPALADALYEVVTSGDLARRYATAARERLKECFSTERMLRRLTAAYGAARAA